MVLSANGFWRIADRPRHAVLLRTEVQIHRSERGVVPAQLALCSLVMRRRAKAAPCAAIYRDGMTCKTNPVAL